MGKIVKRNQPCLDPKCGSSDALQIYEDGGSTCYSCNKSFKAKETEMGEPELKEEKGDSNSRLLEIASFPSRGFIERKITKGVSEFYGVKVSYDSTGEIDTHYYPYVEEDNTYYKVRRLPKTFSSVGKAKGLFGKHLFPGGGKRLVITEGELDALSVAQANWDKYKKFYPVISVPSAAATGEQQLLASRDWLRSFDEVVLFFDNDKVGKEITEKALRIIGIDKVKIAVAPPGCKDASDILKEVGSERLLQCIWDAAPYVPVGIISKEDIWKAIQERNKVVSIPFPDCLAGVNSKIKGRRYGEITLFISGTGSGKSTITREIIIHAIDHTEDKVGIISLEESPAETGMKLSGMAIYKNPAHEEIPEDELKEGFDKVFNSDRIILLDHQGAIKDASIIDQLEYMCLMGCKQIIVDHITILVSEGSEGLTGNEAIDKIMNDLLRVVKRHDVWIGLVSHLRKVQTGGKSFEDGRLPSLDDIRGSGSIKQVSFDVIAFARNLNAAQETERNQITMAVLKSRTIGLTGPVTGAYYTQATGRLTASDNSPDGDMLVPIL